MDRLGSLRVSQKVRSVRRARAEAETGRQADRAAAGGQAGRQAGKQYGYCLYLSQDKYRLSRLAFFLGLPIMELSGLSGLGLAPSRAPSGAGSAGARSAKSASSKLPPAAEGKGKTEDEYAIILTI